MQKSILYLVKISFAQIIIKYNAFLPPYNMTIFLWIRANMLLKIYSIKIKYFTLTEHKSREIHTILLSVKLF